MALSYYIQIIISVLGYGGHIWLGYANPMIRLPVFFMGICAGVFCIRIQQGDVDAFHSMCIHDKYRNSLVLSTSILVILKNGDFMPLVLSFGYIFRLQLNTALLKNTP